MGFTTCNELHGEMSQLCSFILCRVDDGYCSVLFRGTGWRKRTANGAGKGKGSAVESRGELPPGWGVLEWGSSYSFLQLGGSISAAIDTHVKLIARRYFGFGCYVPVSLSCDCPFLGQHKTHWISLLSVCNVNPKYKQQQMQDLTKRARVVWCSDTSTAHPLLCHLVLSVQSVLRFPWLSHQFSQFTHISEDEFKPIWPPWGSE